MTNLTKKPIALCVKHLWHFEVFSSVSSLLIQLQVLKTHNTQKAHVSRPIMNLAFEGHRCRNREMTDMRMILDLGRWWTELAFPPPPPPTLTAAAALHRHRPKCQENSNALPLLPPCCPIPHSFALSPRHLYHFPPLHYTPSNSGDSYQVVPQLTSPLSS